jgi:anti-sigma factor RsiW
MSPQTGPIGEDDLQAYVDDRLDPDRRRDVEVRLDADPILKLRTDALRSHNEALRAEAADRLSAPIPVRLRMSEIRRERAARQRVRPRQIAAGFALLATGLIIGLMIDLRSPKIVSRAPMADAMSAYRVFADRSDDAVEIEATRRVVLVNRIAGHLGRDLAIPDLSPIGVVLLGGRLLASDEGPGGMFIYADAKGERIAVYVKTLADHRQSAFGSRQDSDVIAYYWFDGRLGYAVTGKAGSSIVAAAADVVRATYR